LNGIKENGLTKSITSCPVICPLIGFDKVDTMQLAREIGTYDESTSKATGCKAVPKGPSTKAHLAEILAIEQALEATKMPLPG